MNKSDTEFVSLLRNFSSRGSSSSSIDTTRITLSSNLYDELTCIEGIGRGCRRDDGQVIIF